MTLNAEFVTSLQQVEAAEWESLCGTDYPFLRHHFLLGLEQSGCTTAETGWQPCHLILREGEQAVAALPLYLKSHSYGEYVFDWSWSQAWQSNGLQYYPKLVSAIPFTPATGPRLCYRADLDSEQAWSMAIRALEQFAQQQELSSWHLLFPEQAVSDALLTHGIHQRRATQFHWFNEGYRSFDEFLARFSSRKRKSLKRERRRIEEQGLVLERLVGDQISSEHWDFFHRCYQFTYAKRSGHGGYLTREFFTEVAAAMGEQVILVLARDGEAPVAGALYFRSGDTLFGRYWGCLREYDCLHFEACYYQGIEFCIEQGIRRFDPGAQGEHKIARGFTPVETYSAHWLRHPEFFAAIGAYVDQESRHIDRYIEAVDQHSPYRE